MKNCDFCGKECLPIELVDGTCYECLVDDCVDMDYEPIESTVSYFTTSGGTFASCNCEDYPCCGH